MTVIPALEIMKAVTDKNIQGDGAIARNQAFELANELMAEADVDILIPYQIYNRISVRLNDDHKSAFESLYRIDQSTNNASDLNTIEAIKVVSNAESKARGVVILTENLSEYPQNDSIKVLKPEDFIALVNVARSLKRRGVISSIDDGLFWIFFQNN